MTRKARIFVAQFAFGGSGGTAWMIPELAAWSCLAYHRLMNDHRIELVNDPRTWLYSDTPIYLTRNRAIKDARELGYDMILMLDSDNEPDAYYGREDGAKLFLDEPFDFVYDRWLKGLPTFMAAPYCGPPPHPLPRPGVIDSGEVPYLFQWTNIESDVEQWKISMLTREHAAILKGIVPMACLPTGVSLSTLSVWDGPPKPHFDYEHDEEKTVKKSSEDCYATRNISLYWHMKGIETCFAACDSWALHHKPKRVGKPRMPVAEQIAKNMRDVVMRDVSGTSEMRMVDFTAALDQPKPGTVNFYPPGSLGSLSLPGNLPRKCHTLTHDQNEVYITDEELEEARVELDRKQPNITRAVIHDLPELDEDSMVSVAVEEKSNGHPLTHRMICGRKIATLTHEISDDDLVAIQALAAHAARNGPIEVAVAVCGSGQATAAILHELPEGSHLYALDCINMHYMSAKPSIEFAKSFQPELESGRVMAQIEGRKFPWPESQQHLDLVFMERSITYEKAAKWVEHVRDGGILAGLKNVSIGESLAKDCGLKFKHTGEVWAIQK